MDRLARAWHRVSLVYLSDRFLTAVVSLGLLIRLRDYLHNRSLWLDEAKISMNVLTRSFSQLLEPLDFEQGGPAGWLLIQKLTTLALGPSELALRLVAFLSGCLALILLPPVARRFLPRSAAPLVVLLFAFSGPMLHYTIEVKQYATDVLFAVLLLRAVPDPESKGEWIGRKCLTAAIGAIAILFSHPSIFIMGGIFLTWWLSDARERNRRSFLLDSGLAAAWGLVFLLNYVLFFRELGASEHLRGHWSDEFMPPIWRVGEAWWWLAENFYDIFEDIPMYFDDFAGLGIALWLAGAVAMVRSQRNRLALLLSPLLLVLAASAAHRYPFQGRLVLFMLVPMLIITAAGCHALFRLLPAKLHFIPILLAACLALSNIEVSGEILVRGRDREELRDVLDYVRREIKPGEGVFLGESVAISWRYYTQFFPERFNFSNQPLLEYDGPDDGVLDALRRESLSRPVPRRVWFIFSHHGDKELDELLDELDSAGKRLDEYLEKRSAAFLYEFPPEERFSKKFLKNRRGGGIQGRSPYFFQNKSIVLRLLLIPLNEMIKKI